MLTWHWKIDVNAVFFVYNITIKKHSANSVKLNITYILASMRNVIENIDGHNEASSFL